MCADPGKNCRADGNSEPRARPLQTANPLRGLDRRIGPPFALTLTVIVNGDAQKVDSRMDHAHLLGLQTQRVMQRRMDIAAQNLANMSTAGFKADAIIFEEITRDPARSTDTPHDIRFVRDIGLARDLRQGTIRRTDNPLDLAIEGEGYFPVQGPGGATLYTRDGAFTLNGQGQLVTSDGFPVLSDAGAPLVFDPRGERPTIGRDGSILIAGAQAGRVGVATFERPGAMLKVGDNLWDPDGQPPGAFTGVLVQGALEDSNVEPILEMTNIIQISRAYESAARIVREADQLRQRAIERLGRAS